MKTKGDGIMQKQSATIGLTLAALAGALIAAPALSDQVVIARLAPVTDSAAHGLVEQKLTLTTDKPAGITHEPVYKHTPKYGVLHIGNAQKNQVVVVLDAPEDPKFLPTLYVDSNGDGDLTNEKPVKLAFPPLPKPEAKPASNKTDKTKEAKKETKKDDSKPAPKPALEGLAPVIERYNAAGRTESVDGAIKFVFRDGEISYVSDIVRAGKIKLGEREYNIALVDETGTALFNSYDHDDDQPVKVHLLVAKSDGKFDPKKGTFDAFTPFRLGVGSYQVKAIDPRGQFLQVGAAAREVKGSISPADLKPGSDIIEFDAKRTDGKAVAFPSDYKGKIVMLDFWATWCGPCIEEMPNVVSVYNQYHEKGFEILGISLDLPNQLQQVTDFAQAHGMTWPQIYDGGYWKAEIAQLYGVDSIPRAILVDGTTGKIIGMGDELRGPGLEPAVAKGLANLGK